MKKKLLLFFALVATFVCLFAITSSAVEIDGIYYSLTKTDTYETYAGTAKVTNENATSCELIDVNIPEYVEYDNDGDGVKEKYVVTEIAAHAFSGSQSNWGKNQTVQTMVIPKTVSYIGWHFLRECESIKRVTIKAKNEAGIELADAEFYNCKNLEYIDMSESDITKFNQYQFYGCGKLTQDNISLPPRLSYIGTNCFELCTSLEGLDLSNCPVTTIGNYSFRSCTAMTEIKFPVTLETIGCNAFQNDKLITKIVLPKSIKKMSNHIFAFCSGLQLIVLPEFDETCEIHSEIFYDIHPKVVIYSGDNHEYLQGLVKNLANYQVKPFNEYDTTATYKTGTIYYGAKTKDSVNYYQFDGFDKAWCEWNATTNVKTNYAPVAEALGYSIREKGEIKDGIIAGFKLDPASRDAYEKYFGEITLGVFVANAGKFTGNDFIVDGEITNTFGVQLEITQRDYHKVNCTVVGMSEATDVPPLAYALYVLDSEGNVVDYIQKDDYASGTFANVATAGENTLIAVTLAEVEAIISKK